MERKNLNRIPQMSIRKRGCGWQVTDKRSQPTDQLSMKMSTDKTSLSYNPTSFNLRFLQLIEPNNEITATITTMLAVFAVVPFVASLH
jgi:hypothetical protein